MKIKIFFLTVWSVFLTQAADQNPQQISPEVRAYFDEWKTSDKWWKKAFDVSDPNKLHRIETGYVDDTLSMCMSCEDIPAIYNLLLVPGIMIRNGGSFVSLFNYWGRQLRDMKSYNKNDLLHAFLKHDRSLVAAKENILPQATLLHYVASVEEAMILLEYGADINCVDTYQETALQCYISNKRWDLVKFALQNDADPTIKNIWNQDAQKRAEICGVLQRYKQVVREIEQEKCLAVMTAFAHRFDYVGTPQDTRYKIQ